MIRNDGADASQGVQRVYITDYSTNANIGDYFPDYMLSDRVMLVEVNDEALAIARAMLPGTFWFIRNLRVKHGNQGVLEGRLREKQGSRKLNEADRRQEPHLGALLRYQIHCHQSISF